MKLINKFLLYKNSMTSSFCSFLLDLRLLVELPFLVGSFG